MKLNKSTFDKDFNPKNKKHRYKLYEETFLQNNVESLIFTLQKESINLSTQTLAVALDPNRENLLNLAEAVGDVETMIEVVKQVIPKLQEASNNVKHGKLLNLKSRTDENKAKSKEVQEPTHKESDELTEATKKATKAFNDFNQLFPDKKGLFNFLRYLRKYFTK